MTNGQQGLLWLALGLAGCELGPVEAEQESSGCDESSCDEDESTGADTTDTADTGASSTEPVTANAVDVLVVLDNSGWMAEEQALVGEQLGGLVEALTAGGYDARFAATTTDTGNYWCRSELLTAPAHGRFESTSCLDRLDEFHFGGDEADAEAVCTDHCSLPAVETTGQVPWIESGSTGTNLSTNADAAEAAACLALPGINGCGYEAPLQALSLSLEHTQSPEHDEFGFLRDDAHLLVVFISDEADCSANPAVEDIVFGEGGTGNQVFWPRAEDPAPGSAICWNAGVACAGGDCWPENYDIEGNPTDDPQEAALVPVSHYLDELVELRNAKKQRGAEVFVFGILGVPVDYPQTHSLTYGEGPDAEDPQSFDAIFGTAPGCTSTVGEAVPPVRLRAVIESEEMSPANNIYSICATDYAPAFAAMADAVASHGP